MEFSSFIPRKGSEKRPKPVNPSNNANDPNETVVDFGWGPMLQSHLKAQENTNPSPPPTPPVGPNSPRNPRSTPSYSALYNAPTTVFPRIDPNAPAPQAPQVPRPPVQSPTGRRSSAEHPRVQSVRPQPQTAPANHSHATPYPSSNPEGPTHTSSANHDLPRSYAEIEMVAQRVCRYYGDNRAILIVMGDQIVGTSKVGVRLIEPYTNGKVKLVPWHRVHDFSGAKNDPMLNY